MLTHPQRAASRSTAHHRAGSRSTARGTGSRRYGQPAYGQQPYGGSPYGGSPYGGPPPQPYANWGQRVGAFIIDLLVTIPAYILMIPGYVMILSSIHTDTNCDAYGNCQTVSHGSPSPAAFILIFLGGLVALGLQIWNRWIKGGQGQSIGKKVLGISLISANTGQPIGTGLAFVRDIAHFLDSIICYLGYLWPLWDARRQTFSDKVMSTVVVQGPPPR
ncbi:RDD family protein [Flexivirga caeni]|uniref:RDD family protein n=1 Tax=Flexivirga caeni TaxID=2294115 RepID=UPI0024822AAA|nr:RDD family protein [Flexivirga caeni]